MTEKKTDETADVRSETDPRNLKAVSGSLRYAFRVSDSLLLKLYSVFFVGASAFVTLLWMLAVVTWIGRLSDAPPTGNIWGFIPFLIVVYLALEAVLFLPLYLPMRRYRNAKADG